MRDIAGTDVDRRAKALACLRFLCPSFFGNKQADIVICRLRTYNAIVDCLCNLLPEAQKAENDPPSRTQPERNALYVLHQILCFDVAKASKAGVVSRWLAQYPFGGAHDLGDKKKTVMEILDNGPIYEDCDFRSTMRAVLGYMKRNPLLRKEMVEHGLLDVSKINDDDWNMVPYQTTNTTRSGIPVRSSNRPREESFEEQALRRRRREAMVLGEVGRPIVDIIERDSAAVDGFRSQVTSLFDELEEESEQPVVAVADEDVEEELELLMEEVTQAEPARHGAWWAWLTRLRPDGMAREPS